VQFNQIYTAETAKKLLLCLCSFHQRSDHPGNTVNLSAIGVETAFLSPGKLLPKPTTLVLTSCAQKAWTANRYRSTPELIMSEVAPGDMFGAAYEYLDETSR
jgi:hypothetical protein